MSTEKIVQEHPAVRAAKRAVRSALSVLTDEQVFRLAHLAEMYRFGEDRARWEDLAEARQIGRDMDRVARRLPGDRLTRGMGGAR
jgi:hypothetical protein